MFSKMKLRKISGWSQAILILSRIDMLLFLFCPVYTYGFTALLCHIFRDSLTKEYRSRELLEK